MFPNSLKGSAIAAVSSLLLLAPSKAATITFDDLPLGPSGYWNGSTPPAGGFTSGGATFHNSYTAAFDSWEGFAYSSVSDTTTAGFGNQYASITGGGAGGSSTYAVGTAFDPAVITFGAAVNLNGASVAVTNTTYAALSMEQGDSFAKKFGGATGNDPDFLLLTLTGYAAGVATGTVNFYLADFRSADNSQDYIVKSWQTLDLSGLGTVDEIDFTMSSSDVGAFGMNTPAYFALDNLTTVPEPAACSLAVAGLGLAVLRRRR